MMKPLKYLLSILFLSSLLFTQYACNKAEEELVTEEELKVGWSEEPNKLIYRANTGSIGLAYTFTFDGDVCISCVLDITYPSAEIARLAYDSLSPDERSMTKISGKVLTVDLGEGYDGLSKAQIKAMIGTILDGWK